MEWTTLYVSSVTHAMRGRKLLEQQGITVVMKRSFNNNENNGCGYSLSVNGNAKNAEQLLQKAGIRVLRVEHGGGRM